MSVRRYEISDEQWEQIKDMFPRAKTGRPPKDDRVMFNAILWLARSGAAWADIPERYGPHQTVYCPKLYGQHKKDPLGRKY